MPDHIFDSHLHDRLSKCRVSTGFMNLQELLTICSTATIASTIAIVAHIPGSKDTVQQPQSDPVRCMFSRSCSHVKQSPSLGTDSCVLPGVDDCLPTTFWSNVMPEEWWLDTRVLTLLFDQEISFGVQLVVHGYGFVLFGCQNLPLHGCHTTCSLSWLDSGLHDVRLSG